MAVALNGNNPGGIDDGPWARRQPGYVGANGRYARFDTLGHGMDAIVHLIAIYIGHGHNTVAAAINRWAPSSDGNDTKAYIAHVAAAIGKAPTALLVIADAGKIALAIARQENGGFDKAWAAYSASVGHGGR